MAKSSSTSIPQSPLPPGDMSLARMASQSQLDFELAFFGSLLQRHPNAIEMLRVHARNLSTLRRHAESLAFDRRIVQLRPTDPQGHYDLACTYALLHQREAAIASLRRAVELGYRDYHFMRRDRDLDSIRKDPRVRQILRECEKA